MQHTESASHVVFQSAVVSNGNASSTIQNRPQANEKHVWPCDIWCREVNSKQKKCSSFEPFRKQMSVVVGKKRL